MKNFDFTSCLTLQDLLNTRAKFLEDLNKEFLELKNKSIEEKKAQGPLLQNKKRLIEEAFEKKKTYFESIELNLLNKTDKESLSFKASNFFYKKNPSSKHPLSVIKKELEDVFFSMGFKILDGPHVEEEFFNFTALNIPDDHPARDSQDTFWVTDTKVLRTHTSNIQVRAMREYGAPLRAISAGRVFRNERTDASHEISFHQMEGIVIDKNINVANMLKIVEYLLEEIFQKKIVYRIRPGFFPFVEPGFELDIECTLCKGSGCSVCKQTGWVETLPCGLVHPEVLKHGNIDTLKYSGFAFGLGLDRLVMMKHKITDIRLLYSGDLRFLKQF
jgi:phenylalanyl-tRNA synthetase alpha chain